MMTQAAEWQALPAIPDKEGFASPFAGVCDDRLVVAGGANFPDQKPWEGGTKIWYDDVFVLDSPEGEWRKIGKLPRPLGYGVSISHGDAMICIGGSDAAQHFREVFRLRLVGDEVKTEPLPLLPKACANMSGVLLGETIYVLGGIETPASTEVLHQLWALDLSALDKGWQELEAWPGSGRMLAAVGTADHAVVITGGAALRASADGKAERLWLKDSFAWTAGNGWKTLPDAPAVSVAAPTPMPLVAGRLLLIGGDDGSQLQATPQTHRGFPKTIYALDLKSSHWQPVGEVPTGLVTTNTVIWRDRLIVPGGEAKPGIRSTEVWSLSLKKN